MGTTTHSHKHTHTLERLWEVVQMAPETFGYQSRLTLGGFPPWRGSITLRALAGEGRLEWGTVAPLPLARPQTWGGQRLEFPHFIKASGGVLFGMGLSPPIICKAGWMADAMDEMNAQK